MTPHTHTTIHTHTVSVTPPILVCQLRQPGNAPLHPVHLGLVGGQLEVHDEVGRVAGRRERALALGRLVEGAHVVRVLDEVVQRGGAQPHHRQLDEEHLGLALGEHAGLLGVARALEEEAVDVHAVLGRLGRVLRQHAVLEVDRVDGDRVAPRAARSSASSR